METVEVAELGRANIITLMLKQILERNLRDPGKGRLMANRQLVVQVRVGRMTSTVFFEADRVRAENGLHGKPDVVVSGSMGGLLAVALGQSPLRQIRRRRLWIALKRLRGWVHGLRLLLLMQIGEPPFLLRWMTRRRRPSAA